MNHYPYGTGNRLEDRNTYFYTPYLGRDFFIAWQNQRTAALQLACKQTANSVINKPTDRLIADLFVSLTRGDKRAIIWLQIDKLLQRFEVSKRLHGEYNANWRPIDPSDYEHNERYLLFAELINLAFETSGKLQYLNTLLKCMDTLTAMAAKLDISQKRRLDELTCQERKHIQTLGILININSKAFEK